ncbi:SGNH/GDSL hydrolase family protein [Alteromonas halophila]|uniref:SGNH hydrolase-type esterase domain-containing protein n=1 Tax=Alteromonas halophila TaxID=516698 RepID=A0A918JLC1_9ALTE|nr:SGNH/GDSL hydrolase family protein [Alteromonas halophila]GGW88117.1 hypothetical protein GCM10007391_22360 [Alteromonas halophila]
MTNSRLRTLTFASIMVCIPLLFLAGAEITLRLTGVGSEYPLFVNASQPGYLKPNPDLVKRFVHQGSQAPNVSPDTYFFKQQKPANTLRLVVMGGSTAAGFPYGRFGSPAGLLQQRVQASYPDRDIEVLSVALSSVNSYTLRDIADEVAAIQPDAVLIYAGHNEYLGIMGAGATTGGHMANLAFLALNEFRLFQVLQRALAPAQAASAGADTSSAGRTVMATLARDRAIALDSDVYHQGIKQFTDNMTAVLRTFRQSNIPVLLSTLAANEADQPPFKSSPTPGLQLPALPSTETIKQAIQQFPDSAKLYYMLANTQADSDPDAAHQNYIQAMDRDLLRFRAPSRFNALIKQFSQASGVYLVDSAAALRHDSDTRSIGRQHMLEHLHPNERGYFIVAQRFYEVLEDTGLLPVSTNRISQQVAWQQRPLTAIDSLYASYKIAALTSDYPFTDTPEVFKLPSPQSQTEAMAVNRYQGEPWITQQPHLLTLSQRRQQWHNAATVANTLATALPFDGKAAHVASQLSLKSERFGEAVYFARRAVALNASDINPQLTLAEALYKFGRRTKAIAVLTEAKQQFPGDNRPAYYLQQVSKN